MLGPIAALESLCQAAGVQELLFPDAGAAGVMLRRALQAAHAAGARCQVERPADAMPASSTPLRPLDIDDLLRPPPLVHPPPDLPRLAMGRPVLVTGAGGSIGRELCRQLAAGGVDALLLLGHGEHSIFELQQELTERWPGVRQEGRILDIRDHAAVQRLLRRTRPAFLVHAAAHKHVPLMEGNVAEAIGNNVLGTRVVLESAVETGVARAIVISTDKAVRPTSVMGATKRVAEQLAQHGSGTANLSATRFGNVSGSRGSVIPIFQRQILAGRPITLTDPAMRRYFLPTTDAVALLLAAAELATGGEVFALDMGEPVPIGELAADLVRLSGSAVPIVVTGARPGEKLHEEPFFRAPFAEPTAHPRVHRSLGVELPADFTDRLDGVLHAARRGAEDADLRRALRDLVPDFAEAAPSR